MPALLTRPCRLPHAAPAEGRGRTDHGPCGHQPKQPRPRVLWGAGVASGMHLRRDAAVMQPPSPDHLTLRLQASAHTCAPRLVRVVQVSRAPRTSLCHAAPATWLPPRLAVPELPYPLHPCAIAQKVLGKLDVLGVERGSPAGKTARGRASCNGDVHRVVKPFQRSGETVNPLGRGMTCLFKLRRLTCMRIRPVWRPNIPDLCWAPPGAVYVARARVSMRHPT